MADDKNTAPPKTIPVRTLRFLSATVIDLPGSARHGSSVTQRDPDDSKKERYAIDFIPGMRHHRVQWFAAGHDGKAPPTETRYVPETHVATWEPLG